MDDMALKLILRLSRTFCLSQSFRSQYSAGLKKMVKLREASQTSEKAWQNARICHCHQVLASTIHAAIDRGESSLEDLKRCTGAGTGCGACQCRLKRMLLNLSVD